MKINPYLNFAGSTEEAFNFYKSVFGGEFSMFQRFGDMPDGQNIPEDAKNMVMHVSLPIGDGNVLMGTDAPESMGFKVTQGNNFYICVSPDSKEEADRIFNSLSQGGNVKMPLEQMFWGAYYGELIDKFGIKWMINYMPQQ